MMTGGRSNALEGVNLGEVDRELTESADGDEDLEEVFSARANVSSLSSSMFSCLTDSGLSTSMASLSADAQVSEARVTLNPSDFAASSDFVSVEFCSARNLMCATAPRKTLTRWHFDVTCSRCLGGSNRVRSSINWLMQSRRLRSTRLCVSRRR